MRAHSSSHLRVCLFVCQDLAIFLLIFVEVVLYTFLIYDIRRRLQHTLLIISPILRANFVGENAQNLKICTFCYHILQVFHKNILTKIVSFFFISCFRALLFTLIQRKLKMNHNFWNQLFFEILDGNSFFFRVDDYPRIKFNSTSFCIVQILFMIEM